MKLTTRRLILRDVELADAEPIKKYIDNINISRYLLVVPHPYTKKDALWWVNHCAEEQKKDPRTSYELGIVLKTQPREVIGGAGITHIDSGQGTAELGYWLAEDYWRQGIMSEAVRKLISFSFEDLKLRRLIIPAFSGNAASNGLAKKLGFTFEGKLRQAAVCKATGEIHDENMHSLLRNEWRKR